MVMLSVISQGLQIYIWALFNCGFLLCEKVSSYFLQESSEIKNSLRFIRLYTKREISRLKFKRKGGQTELQWNIAITFSLLLEKDIFS